VTTLLLMLALLLASIFHAPVWMFFALFVLTVFEFGFELGRFRRREVIYIRHDDGTTRRHIEQSGENIRTAYREAKLQEPIVISVPAGMTVSRHNN